MTAVKQAELDLLIRRAEESRDPLIRELRERLVGVLAELGPLAVEVARLETETTECYRETADLEADLAEAEYRADELDRRVESLQAFVLALADRVHRQSELLGRRAGGGPREYRRNSRR